MQAGGLRERVTFQTRSSTVDGLGEQAATWTDVVTVWAAVEPLAGREFFAAQQVQSDVSVRIRCRYSREVSSFTTRTRIKHGAAFYDIRSVIKVGSRNVELQFMCTQHSIT